MGSVFSRFLQVLVWIMFLSGCARTTDNSVDSPRDSEAEKSKFKLHPKVIYGEDDRLDLYQVEDGAILLLARSTAAMIRTRLLEFNGSSQTYDIQSQIYGQKYRLCEDEAYWTQPVGPSCSGFLVGDDILITAGHCIRTQGSCDTVSFVFDYAFTDSLDEQPDKNISVNQVYSCKHLLHSTSGVNSADFAVVQLDRPVIGRTPLELNTNPTQVGDPLVVIGHPVGLPTKVAGGARVRSLEAEYFVANLDTYGGNSGSAVFNSETGLVEGLLVRGARDFIERDGCRASNLCADNGCSGEDVTRISEVLDHLPSLNIRR